MASSATHSAASSRRVSLDSQSIRSTTSSPALTQARPRAARSALRDYYNLTSPINFSSEPAPPTVISHLDTPSFSTSAYLSQLLSTASLPEILRIESALVSEIRTLDGEKKGLVYDNYSKLIKATETIRRMREGLEPVMPTVKTLGPAVAGIEGLVQGCGVEEESNADVVRWVLRAPERCRVLGSVGRDQDAKALWEEVENVLNGWNGVKGVDEVRGRGRKVIEQLGQKNGEKVV